jgi:small subunit ribosomal protein S29
MSISLCTRCMSQLHLQSSRHTIPRAATSLSQTSGFHTTTSMLAGNHKVKYRDVKRASHKGKGRERKKLPPIGERRQLRNRIVLSNTNAVEVKGLEDLSKMNFNSAEAVGSMLAFDGQVIDQLRELKAFKRTQNWSLFRKPAALMRTESGEVAKMIEGVMRASGGREPETKRMIITGGQAAGKSIMLLQAQAMALVNNWVVINVHDGKSTLDPSNLIDLTVDQLKTTSTTTSPTHHSPDQTKTNPSSTSRPPSPQPSYKGPPTPTRKSLPSLNPITHHQKISPSAPPRPRTCTQ